MSDLFLELNADVIAKAASSFDGHVTHGSLDAILKCVGELYEKRMELMMQAMLEASDKLMEKGLYESANDWRRSTALIHDFYDEVK